MYRPKTILLGGGVAANSLLRQTLASAVLDELRATKLLIPDMTYTGDNAAMIAAAAYFEGRRDQWESLGVDPNWRLGEKRGHL